MTKTLGRLYYQDMGHNQALEKVASCPSCGSRAREMVIAECKDLLVLSGDTRHNLFRCKSCELVYLSPRPRPESLHVFYPKEYLPFSPASELGGRRTQPFEKLIMWSKQRCKDIFTLPYRMRFGSPTTTFAPFGNRRLLEIGCGNGEFLASMKALGWDVYGCDIDKTKVNHICNSLGLHHKVFCGDVTDQKFPSEYFDAVVMWHVIEHLYDPFKILRHVHKLLSADGKIVIGTPNVDGIEAKMFGRWWMGYDVPRHVILFSEATLCEALKANNFCVELVRPSLSATSVSDSIALFIRGRFHRQIWGGRIHRAMYYALYPLYVWTYAFGNLSIMEVRAAKAKESATLNCSKADPWCENASQRHQKTPQTKSRSL